LTGEVFIIMIKTVKITTPDYRRFQTNLYLIRRRRLL
jgi:hypothetical protein